MLFHVVVGDGMHLLREVQKIECEVTEIVFFVLLENGLEVVVVKCMTEKRPFSAHPPVVSAPCAHASFSCDVCALGGGGSTKTT